MTYSGKQKPGKKTRRESRSKTGPAPSSEEAERAMLLQALTEHCGNLTLAAQAVGYTREVFVSVLRRHGIGEVM